MLLVIVRGSGDVGSAVAHRLFLSGYRVLLHDEPEPTATRRGMAFTDALAAGSAVLEGVTAVRVDDLAALDSILSEHKVLPVVVADLTTVLQVVAPDVLVDARMRKRAQPEVQRGLAALTIGLGPNFVAGETTDLAVETAWGERLGKVLTTGATLPLMGEPQPIAGHARDRYIYAPADGEFLTALRIGDAVRAGQVVAHVGPAPLTAPLDGVLRGLTASGTRVARGTKVIEVDPRGAAGVVTGIGERPRRIADGVLEGIELWTRRQRAGLP